MAFHVSPWGLKALWLGAESICFTHFNTPCSTVIQSVKAFAQREISHHANMLVNASRTVSFKIMATSFHQNYTNIYSNIAVESHLDRNEVPTFHLNYQQTVINFGEVPFISTWFSDVVMSESREHACSWSTTQQLVYKHHGDRSRKANVAPLTCVAPPSLGIHTDLPSLMSERWRRLGKNNWSVKMFTNCGWE